MGRERGPAAGRNRARDLAEALGLYFEDKPDFVVSKLLIITPVYVPE